MKREESSRSGCEVSSLCTGFVADYYIFHQREINCERFEPRKRSAFSFLCRFVTVCLTCCQRDKGINLGF